MKVGGLRGHRQDREWAVCVEGGSGSNDMVHGICYQ